jgi:hypothetical protein
LLPSFQPISFKPSSKASTSACPSASRLVSPPISTATRRFCSRCCADAASGHAMVEPAIPLMKSRRRIAFLKAWDHANRSMITAGIYDRRNGVSLSFCSATIITTECPLWVVGSIGQCNTCIKSRSARVSKPKVSRDRSLSCRATRLSCECAPPAVPQLLLGHRVEPSNISSTHRPSTPSLGLR